VRNFGMNGLGVTTIKSSTFGANAFNKFAKKMAEVGWRLQGNICEITKIFTFIKIINYSRIFKTFAGTPPIIA
jgi:hypothetical protein